MASRPSALVPVQLGQGQDWNQDASGSGAKGFTGDTTVKWALGSGLPWTPNACPRPSGGLVEAAHAAEWTASQPPIQSPPCSVIGKNTLI